MNFALGLDLGGTNIKLVCVEASGKLIAQQSIATHDGARATWAEHVKSLIATMEHERSARATWLGLAAPGLATRDHRAIAFMPGRMQGLEQLDWTNFLQRTRRVTVLNDAHAALLGEHWLGAARNFENALLLTLGTGVGGAILSQGKLLTGTIGRAGHLGHTCLNLNGEKDIVHTPGSIELLMGDCTIHQRSNGLFSSTEKLVAAHLAGGMSKAGAALFQPLENFLNELEWRPGDHRVKILPAQLEDWAGAFGAARFAMLEVG